jgi:hypothetical protein
MDVKYMSMSDFRNARIVEGHSVEVSAETHEDINSVPVRTVVYRSKDFVPSKAIEEEILLLDEVMFDSTVTTSVEVDQCLIDLASANWSN